MKIQSDAHKETCVIKIDSANPAALLWRSNFFARSVQTPVAVESNVNPVTLQGFDTNVGLFRATSDNKLYPSPAAGAQVSQVSPTHTR